MTIRTGTPQDMPAVLELIKELAAYEKEPGAVAITAHDLVRDGFGERPLFHTFVAEGADGIIGMALFYYRYSTWKGKTIHLEDLIVKEEYRGTGTGSGLYREVIKFAKAENVRRVEWVVLNWNHNAIRFYKKSGAAILEDWRTVQLNEEGITQFVLSL